MEPIVPRSERLSQRMMMKNIAVHARGLEHITGAFDDEEMRGERRLVLFLVNDMQTLSPPQK